MGLDAKEDRCSQLDQEASKIREETPPVLCYDNSGDIPLYGMCRPLLTEEHDPQGPDPDNWLNIAQLFRERIVVTYVEHSTDVVLFTRPALKAGNYVFCCLETCVVTG